MINRKVFENGVLVESSTVIEDPPGTFTFTRMDGGAGVMEERAATMEEIGARAA